MSVIGFTVGYSVFPCAKNWAPMRITVDGITPVVKDAAGCLPLQASVFLGSLHGKQHGFTTQRQPDP